MSLSEFPEYISVIWSSSKILWLSEISSSLTIPPQGEGSVYQEEFRSLTFYPSYRAGLDGVCVCGDGEPFPSIFTQ